MSNLPITNSFLFLKKIYHVTQVVGVPDQRMGEEICAWVRCKSGVQLTADELRQFCRQNVKILQ